MEQGKTSAGNGAGTGKLIIGLAAVILIAAIVYAVMRDGRAQKAPVATASPSPAAGLPTLAALQEKVRTVPGDVAAWQALGEAQFEQEHFAEAAAAYERGTALAPARGNLWSALGEARVMASKSDPMPAAAVTAFEKAVAIDAKDPRARYFLAVRRDLAGDHKGAIEDWFALLRDTPPGAPWEQDLRRTIAQVGKINAIPVEPRLAASASPVAHPGLPGSESPAMPGPTPEQLRAAAALAPSEQNQMAQGMVASLEAKLKANPANVDGWVMLMRSRMTLGEPAKAEAARRAAVAANPAAKARIESEAAAMRVPAG